MFVKNMFSKISDDTILWRYLSFPKFLDILETSSLYFRRIDCFDDKREATQPDGSLRFAQLTENPWQVDDRGGVFVVKSPVSRSQKNKKYNA